MRLENNLDKILIIDFGSQFTQLIARKVRELNIFCEIISHNKLKDYNNEKNVKGIILSGGPLNVYQNKKVKLFIQVNIGNEEQKSGILKNDLDDLYHYCKDLNLDIVGLMCIPPYNSDPNPFFQELQDLNKNLSLKELSMGMSSDYLKALEYNSTYLRIGSAIFGERV